MRVISLFLFVGAFLALPMYLLNSFVMPELQGLAHSYSQADVTAQRIASQAAPTR